MREKYVEGSTYVFSASDLEPLTALGISLEQIVIFLQEVAQAFSLKQTAKEAGVGKLANEAEQHIIASRLGWDEVMMFVPNDCITFPVSELIGQIYQKALVEDGSRV